MQFAENVQATWQEVYCFIMTMPDSIQPNQSRREFKNYNENFLNISTDLASRGFHLFGSLKKNALVAKVSLMTKLLKQRRGSG
jgi:hypothetical protein